MKGQIHDNDLKLMRIFRVVAEHGGFSAAQAELNMSQPTISMHMAHLETRLGMRLCSRGNSGFSLTEEGKFVLQEMEVLFTSIEKFRLQTSDYFSTIRGSIILGVPDAIASHPNRIIVDVIRKFNEEHRLARINVEVFSALELEEKLTKGEVDVAFGFFYHEVNNLTYREIFTEAMSLCCAKGSPVFELPEDELSVEQILKLPYVSRGHYEEVQSLKVNLDFNEQANSIHMEGIALLVMTGRYIGFLPDHYSQQWVERGEMRRLLESELSQTAVCQMALRRRGDRSRALISFLEIVETLGLN